MPLNHPVTFVKKNIYQKYGYFSEEFKYCADNEFIIRIVKEGVIIDFLDTVLGRMELGGVSEKIRTIFKMNREHYLIRLKYKINFYTNLAMSFKHIRKQIVSRIKNELKAI